ncbi:MAG: cell division protein FtsZ [Rubrivivax sp.]|jgi:cell division protein FtsZ
MPIEMIEQFDQGTQIKVIGVGGGGGNAVEHMIAQGVQGVDFICANTDAQALNRSGAGALVQLGATGLGAGSKPDVGRVSAEEAEERIRAAIQGANMLFITAGMGGGTGTGAAPVIARIAKDMGILTVGVVTKPFEFEGKRRSKQADDGVAELEANVDSLIVVLNEKLLEVMGDDVTQEEAFAHANDVLKNAVGGISDIIHIPGLVNVDFEDVKTVMSEPGKAMMGTATASGTNRATKAAEAAVACPLLEGIDLSGARGVLVLIAASKAEFKLSESRNAMNTIRRYAAEDAHVIYGTAYDESLGDQLRVTVIATGLNSQRRADNRTPPLSVVAPVIAAPVAQPVLRTGTDNLPILTQPAAAVTAPSMAAGGTGLPAGITAAPALQQHDYANMASPSVWRTRAQASAKVDSLANSGMDEIEIPAFLRRQAD